ncbi:MAG TPA: hypothetical protein ENH85_12025 [Candidatus Scalindua sp.]|nr:hypothetical protein [Candidatus Scalindua sp.]
MSDRLAEIKGYREAMDGVTDDEADWLISELEQSRDVVKRLNKMQPVANVTLSDDAKYFEGLANKAEAEVKCLKSLLSYQGIPF